MTAAAASLFAASSIEEERLRSMSSACSAGGASDILGAIRFVLICSASVLFTCDR